MILCKVIDVAGDKATVVYPGSVTPRQARVMSSAGDIAAGDNALIDIVDGVAYVVSSTASASVGSSSDMGVLPLNADMVDNYHASSFLLVGTRHSDLPGLESDDHPQYLTTVRHADQQLHGSLVVDHGSIGGLSDDDHPQYLLASGARAGASSQAQAFTNGINTDVVNEMTSNAGVTIDGVLLKDGGATATSSITATRFISNVATGTAPLSVSSTTAVTNLNADMVDGSHAADLAKRQGYSATISAAGWYRIASNGPVAPGGTGGTRASALFTVRDTQSGRHSSTTFYANVHYGANPTLSVLSRSFYSSSGIVRKIRLIEGGVYEGAAVEVYVAEAGSVSFTIYDNEHSAGWTPLNWEAGSVPSGFAVTQIDLDTYEPVLAVATDGNSNQFMVRRSGNVHAPQFQSTVATGTAPLVVTSTTTVSNLSADMVDGVHESSFLLASGTRAGATSQAQVFTNGIIAPSWKPSSDSTNALNIATSTGASIVSIDSTNKRVYIGGTNPTATLQVKGTVGVKSTDDAVWSAMLLAAIGTWTANVTGALVIRPQCGNTFLNLTICGYDYTGSTGAWTINLGGYWYSTGSTWYSTSVNIIGRCPTRLVRLAKDGSNNPLIIIGDTTTVWQYPQITVSAPTTSNGLNPNGWQAAFETDVSSYTIQATPTPLFYFDTSSNMMLGGSASTLPAGRLHVTTGASSDPAIIAVFNNTYRDVGLRVLTSSNKISLQGYTSTGGSTTPLYLQPLGGYLSIGSTITPDTPLYLGVSDSATNTVSNLMTINHRSTGTPSASFGSGLVFRLQTSTTNDVPSGNIESLWNDATHASYKGEMWLSVYDYASKRTPLKLVATGSGSYVATQLIRPLADGTSGIAFYNASGSANILNIDTTNQRIGILRSSPSARLDFGTPGDEIRFSAPSQSPNATLGAITAYDTSNSRSLAQVKMMAGSSGKGQLSFSVHNGTALTEIVRIPESGGIVVTGGASFTDDVTVGNNILFVDYSQANIGVNCAPDQQFDLDVNGNLRARGWIVGKHAIQIKDAILLCHFDGPGPYETNRDGDTTSVLGQKGVGANLLFSAGKFGKAVSVSRATTNLIINPSLEVNTNGWTAYTDRVISRESGGAYGSYCLKITNNGSSQTTDAYSASISVTEGQTYTASLYYMGPYPARLHIFRYNSSGNVIGGSLFTYVDLPASTTWKHASFTATMETGAVTARVAIRNLPVGGSIWIDAVQFENLPYATPYCDGSLGQGHSWSGTAHYSTSSRSAASLYYTGITLPTSGTVMAWVYPTSDAQSGTYRWIFDHNYTAGVILYITNSNNLAAYIGGVMRCSYALNSTSFPKDTWHHVCVTWDESTSSTKLYLNGSLVASGGYGTPTSGANTYVGYYGSSYFDGMIDDMVLIGRAMSADEIRAIYESDAPVFVETSTFAFRTTSASPVWADSEGLWMQDTSGNKILGFYGASATKAWGGKTLEPGDGLIGDASRGGYILWDNSAALMEVAGTIKATAGWIGGNSNHVDIDSYGIDIGTTGRIKGGQTAYNTGTGFWLGYDSGYKLSIGNPSGNYLTWNGTALTVMGTINAVAGYIGNSSNVVAIDSSGINVGNSGRIAGGQTAYNTGSGFWLGYSSGYKFSVGDGSSKYLKWDGSALEVSGTIYATSGNLGGANVVSISSSGISVGSSGRISGGQTAYNTGTGFWLGYDTSTYKFSVGNPSGSYLTWDGSALNVKGNITVVGGDAATQTYTNQRRIVAVSGTFTATDADTISWSGVSIRFGDGTTKTVSDGNTGNMTALTYLYVDATASAPLTLSTTTSLSALGANHVLVGYAKNGTTKASVQILAGATLISGDWINTGTITANHISVSTLSALSVNTGDLTVSGVLSLGSTGELRAGSTSTGIRFGYLSDGYYLRGVNSGTTQFEAKASDGKLYAGGGRVVLDATGIRMTMTDSVFNGLAAYDYSTTQPVVGIGGYHSNFSTQYSDYSYATEAYLYASSEANEPTLYKSAMVDIYASTPSVNSKNAGIVLYSDYNTASKTSIRFIIGSGMSYHMAIINDTGLTVNGSIIGGTLYGYGGGYLAIKDSNYSGVTNCLYINHNSTTTPASAIGVSLTMGAETSTTEDQVIFKLASLWETATHSSRIGSATFYVNYYGGEVAVMKMGVDSSGNPKLGFNGTNMITKPTVTGSKGGNAALASLITALANYGLITDSTT